LLLPGKIEGAIMPHFKALA